MVNQESNRPAARSSVASVPSLTDSFWFWACVFSTAAICGLILASSKYQFRQAQLENRYLARQQGGQTAVGDQGPIQPSSAGQTIISLRPLYVVTGVLLVLAWTTLIWQRSRLARRILAGQEEIGSGA